MNSDLLTLLVAVASGAAIGFERKLNDQNAGIHTNALVSLGAALFVLLSTKLASPSELSRVASQVVMGVGFLGGAVIMRDGLQVRGLNTAVTLWCSSAVGAIAGAGYHELAGVGAAIVMLTNMILHYIEHRSGWFKLPLNTPRNGDKHIP